MQRKIILLIFLWMKGCDGIQLCKQYSLVDSNSYSTYLCPYYCCDTVYSGECCHDNPVSSRDSVHLIRHRRSSSGDNVGLIFTFVTAGFGCLILLHAILIACLQQCVKKNVRVSQAPSPGSMDTVADQVTSPPETTEARMNPHHSHSDADLTHIQNADLTHIQNADLSHMQGERWRY